MSAICIPCAPAQECIEDLDKYNLQDDTFLFVLVCPPGIVCNGSNVVFLLCCDGTTLQGNIPLGSTRARRDQIIAGLVAECERRRSFCGNPPDGTDGHPPTITLYYSAPASCTVFCPDGTPFIYTVPAGVFIASTFEEAQAAAKAYACEQAPNFLLCLGQFNACLCAGTFFSGTISIQSNHAPFRVSVISGSFPAGMQLRTSGNAVIVSGIPTTAGVYPFTIRVTDQFGNQQARTYTIRVISIATTTITGFTVGTPYSFQMQATGGSGNYAWRISAGSLPAGLEMSVTGLITGTPTADAVEETPTFELIDTTCESVSRSFFTPRVSLRTVASTRIRTRRGWPSWTGGEGELYKTATYAGFMTQTATVAPTFANAFDTRPCAGAKYLMSGASSIDAFGRHLTTHQMDLYGECGNQPPFVNSLPNFGLSQLLGWCWATDPQSCSSCNTDETTWALISNNAFFGNADRPNNMLLAQALFSATPTVLSYIPGFISELISVTDRATFPKENINGIFASWCNTTSHGDWTITLSDEYTDAEAITSQQAYSNSSNVAENRPNYQTWVQSTVTNISSKTTSVAYQLNCTNLVVGSSYVVRVILASSSGTNTTVEETFTAAATSHIVTGSVGIPATANQSITVRTPSIAFA